MAAKKKRVAGKPPEEKRTSKRDTRENREQRNSRPESEDEDTQEKELDSEEAMPEFPFKEIDELPKTGTALKRGTGLQNRAPLQADERAQELLGITLRHPVTLTAEDLLNVSEPVRQVLRKLLTKKRVEKKAVTFVRDTSNLKAARNDMYEETSKISIEELPVPTYEVLEEDREGMKKGNIIVSDPVSQYLAHLQPEEKSNLVIVAKESEGLRSIYPVINNVEEVESTLDDGSQIVSMAEKEARKLKITWDSRITIGMESANRAVERTLGLARNVPFQCGTIVVYLQVHVIRNPAYKVLLGRPFDCVTESQINNYRGGDQTLTLTDPNSGIRCVMTTYERGRDPEEKGRKVQMDFRQASRKQC